MRKGQVKVTNRLGLHARAAAKLIRLAEGFTSNIRLIRLDNSTYANAKSILSILTLAAAMGTVLKLEIEGIDEDLAYEAIIEIFENGFGENLE